MTKIKCPGCHNAKFEIIDSGQSQKEIKDLCECKGCKERFFIKYNIIFDSIIKVKNEK